MRLRDMVRSLVLEEEVTAEIDGLAARGEEDNNVVIVDGLFLHDSGVIMHVTLDLEISITPYDSLGGLPEGVDLNSLVMDSQIDAVFPLPPALEGN